MTGENIRRNSVAYTSEIGFCNQRREIGFRTNSSKRILGLIITTSQMTLALTEEDWQINR